MFMAESVYLVVNSFTRRSFTLCVLFSHTHSDTLFCSHSNEWRGWGDASAAAACVYNYSRCEMFSALLYVYNNIDFFYFIECYDFVYVVGTVQCCELILFRV